MKKFKFDLRTYQGYLNDFKEPYRTDLEEAIKQGLEKFNSFMPDDFNMTFEELMESYPPDNSDESPRVAMISVVDPDASKVSWLREDNNLAKYLIDEANNTIGFYVEQIKDKDIREKVINYAVENDALTKKFAVPSVRNAATAITQCFDFKKSEEGVDYWVDVVNDLFEQESQS